MELRQFTEQLVDSELDTKDMKKRLAQYAIDHGWGTLTDGDMDHGTVDISITDATTLHIWTLGLAQRGELVPTDSPLLLKAGEVAYVSEPAILLKEVAQREYQGGSRGVSIPLGHGVRYRTASYRGHMVMVGASWVPADAGALTITDRRIVFQGGRKTVEFLFAKLINLKVYQDAIDLGVTNRQTTSSFKLDDPNYVAGMISTIMQAQATHA